MPVGERQVETVAHGGSQCSRGTGDGGLGRCHYKLLLLLLPPTSPSGCRCCGSVSRGGVRGDEPQEEPELEESFRTRSSALIVHRVKETPSSVP